MPRFYFIPIDGDIPDGALGSAIRARFTEEAAQDVAGHSPQILPADAAELESRMATFNLLPPREAAGSDVPGFHLEPAGGDRALLTSHVLLVDSGQAGKLVGRFVPADDAEGHAVKVRLGTATDDAEGHLVKGKFGAADTDEAPRDAEGHGFKRIGSEDTNVPLNDDAEGHGFRWSADAQSGEAAADDAEGHATKIRFASEGTAEPPTDDSEGHVARYKAAPGSDELPQDDAEGHIARRVDAGGEPPVDDAEGHAARVN